MISIIFVSQYPYQALEIHIAPFIRLRLGNRLIYDSAMYLINYNQLQVRIFKILLKYEIWDPTRKTTIEKGTIKKD